MPTARYSGRFLALLLLASLIVWCVVGCGKTGTIPTTVDQVVVTSAYPKGKEVFEFEFNPLLDRPYECSSEVPIQFKIKSVVGRKPRSVILYVASSGTNFDSKFVEASTESADHEYEYTSTFRTPATSGSYEIIIEAMDVTKVEDHSGNKIEKRVVKILSQPQKFKVGGQAR